MNPGDIQKLLGGYATGTLTQEEQQVLFEAALNDQAIFDALAREQALRDLLRDPAAKAELLAALDAAPVPWYRQFLQYWRPASAVLVMAGVSAIAVVTIRRATPPQPSLVAQVNAPPPTPGPLLESGRSLPPAEALADKRTPITRSPDAPVSGRVQDQLAKGPASKEDRAEESRIAKLRQESDALPERKQKDATAPAGEPVPVSPPTVALGFREAPKPGAVSGFLGGAQPTAPAPPPVKTEMAKARDAATAAPASGGGGSARAAQAQSQAAALQQGQQGQPLQQSPQPSPQQSIQQFRPQSTQESVAITAAESTLETLVAENARSLFYGIQAPRIQSADVQLDTKATSPQLLRKKVAEQQKENERTRQPAANTMARAAKAVEPADRTVNPGVRYSLLRQTGQNQFSQVDAGSLKTGDLVKVQFESNDSGNLLVRERGVDGTWREVLSTQVEKGQSYTTRPLRNGTNEVQVTFAPLPINARGAGFRSDTGEGRVGVKQQTTNEPATYVVGAAASTPVNFIITLNYK